MEQLNRIVFKTYCYQPETANQLNLYIDQKGCQNGAKVKECFQSTLFARYFDLQPSLKELKLPTLLIHGDTDPVPVKAIENIHNSIENSQYVLLEKCGHFPYLEAPDPYFSSIENFLEEKTTRLEETSDQSV